MTEQHLIEAGQDIDLLHEEPDPETWGTSPAAQAELRQAMGAVGGVGDGPDP